jgi:hypothetical protein
MNDPIVYAIILTGFMIFLGIFWILRKRGARSLLASLRSIPLRKQTCEPFYCLRANVRQISPHFYIAQMVFSNKKNIPMDILGAPSKHSDQEHNS